MGQNTGIQWTNIIPGRQGATWNPMKATNTQTGEGGYICVMHGVGCLKCYAQDINMHSKIGNRLPYTMDGLAKAKTWISENEGQTSVHWPIHSKISQGIFVASMTDWMGEFYSVDQINQVAFTMMLAQHHIFITLTKREDRLHNWLVGMTSPDVPGLQIAMNDRHYSEALVKANGNFKKFDAPKWVMRLRNSIVQTAVPWPPPNIIFGVTIVNQQEARTKLGAIARIKAMFPSIMLMVSHEPALEPIDWELLGYQKLIDWLIVGGESGEPWDEPRPIPSLAIPHTITFGEKYGIPVFVKQVGAWMAIQMGLRDTLKGTDVPEEWCVRQFPDVSKRYVPWSSKARKK